MVFSAKDFAHSESGAVTVDWTVLTGAIVGLGLATMTVVAGGIEEAADNINALLGNTDWNAFDNGILELASFDFTGGNAAGWHGGQVMDMGGQLGELLVVGANQTAGYLMQVPPGTETALMAFDLVAGDSLDNSEQWGTDTATLMINDVPVAVAISDSNGPITVDIPQVDGTTVEATITVDNEHLGGSATWDESTARVTVAVDQPTEDLQFHLVSDANQGINDEFWGVDNFNTGITGAPGF